MSHLNRCGWKLINSDNFVLGMDAERCGDPARVRILRPQRKTDLYLCEEHLNCFIEKWGLHYEVEILPATLPDFHAELGVCVDPYCKKCLQDDPRTWRHEPEPAYPLEWSDICRHGRPECQCGGILP